MLSQVETPGPAASKQACIERVKTANLEANFYV